MTFTDTLLPVKTRDGCGFVDRSGQPVTDLRFNECEAPSEGLARVRLGDKEPHTMGCEYGKQGYVNELGELVIPAEFAIARDFSEGLAAVHIDCYYGGGGWVIPAPWEGGVAGYIDRSGKFAIEPRFAWADPFKDGIARVSVAVKTRQKTAKGENDVNALKWGYIDRAGRFVIEPIFDRAEPFSEGLAAVNIGWRPYQNKAVWHGKTLGMKREYFPGEWGYINRQGDFVIQPKYTRASNFQEGRAFATCDAFSPDMDFNDRRDWRLIKRTLNEALGKSEKLSHMAQYVGNLLSSRLNYGLIDQNAHWIIKPKYTETYSFSEGMAAVYRGVIPKCGYIDVDGWERIKPHFDAGFSFSQGVARVAEGGRFGFIDSTGRFMVPPTFANAADFSEGFAPVEVEKEKWSYIRMNGELRDNNRYRSAEPYENGLARVQIGKANSSAWHETYIDIEGRAIWSPLKGSQARGEE